MRSLEMLKCLYRRGLDDQGVAKGLRVSPSLENGHAVALLSQGRGRAKTSRSGAYDNYLET